MIKTFESGLSATAAIFFRFSKGSVRDLLLWRRISWLYQKRRDYHSLYEVEHRNTISHWAQDGISIGSEYDVSLPIDGSTKVGELQSYAHSKREQEFKLYYTLKLAFIWFEEIRKKNSGVGRIKNAPSGHSALQESSAYLLSTKLRTQLRMI